MCLWETILWQNDEEEGKTDANAQSGMESGNEKDKANESNKEKTIMEAAEVKHSDVDMGKKGERNVETGKKEVFDKELLQVCSQKLSKILSMCLYLWCNIQDASIFVNVITFTIRCRLSDSLIEIKLATLGWVKSSVHIVRQNLVQTVVRSFCCLFRLKIWGWSYTTWGNFSPTGMSRWELILKHFPLFFFSIKLLLKAYIPVIELGTCAECTPREQHWTRWPNPL